MMADDNEQLRPQDLLGLTGEEDDDDAGSSEDEGAGRTNISQHRTKRRRVELARADSESDSNIDSDDGEEEGEGEAEEDEDDAPESSFASRLLADPTSLTARPTSPSSPSTTTITNPSKLTPLTPAQLAASAAATAKTGVVYLSRIPPFMKPQKVRSLLSRFGTVGRVFLAPEDPKAHARRVKFGGNKKRNFVEGWVEFTERKHARLAAETLNTNTIGGKKGSYYYDDVWNIKYLPKFKWHHLQAQIAYENASRQARFRAEIAQETRVNKTFLRNVERAKMVENMQETKKQKRKAEGEDEPVATNVDVRRQFRQHKVRGSAADKSEGKEKSERVKNLLSKVF